MKHLYLLFKNKRSKLIAKVVNNEYFQQSYFLSTKISLNNHLINLYHVSYSNMINERSALILKNLI